MPAIRTARRDRTRDPPLGLGIPSRPYLSQERGPRPTRRSAAATLRGSSAPSADRREQRGTAVRYRTGRAQQQAGVLERVHQIVRALINLCGNANARVSGLAPMMARAVDGLIETLTKVHAFLQAQAPHGLFARILRCFEMQEQLNQCADVLQQALDVFGLRPTLDSRPVPRPSSRRASLVPHILVPDRVLSARGCSTLRLLREYGTLVTLASSYNVPGRRKSFIRPA
ncbi:hypothetical protein B0H15DRAFT_961674 [Mycena belliarum]|uniref:Uncharacterized protein n=1 Tax=Mycena belliarum TaxID=1033014 RepID=A0AAD6UFQ8_9AGAR|nr:hypothetical protein B0H15DRAFT_961674 [Mycena belliae]